MSGLSQWHLANSFLAVPHSYIVCSSLYSTVFMTLLLLLLLLSSSLFDVCSISFHCFLFLLIIDFVVHTTIICEYCTVYTRYPHEFLMHMIRMSKALMWSEAKFRYSIWTTNNQKAHFEIALMHGRFGFIGDFEEQKMTKAKQQQQQHRNKQ